MANFETGCKWDELEQTAANWSKLEIVFNYCVGIAGIRATYVHDNLDSTHGALHHGYYLCLWKQVMAHSGRHVTDSRNIPPNA